MTARAEEVRRGRQDASNARQTRSEARRVVEKLGMKRESVARVQLAQQSTVVPVFLTVSRGFFSSFDYCSAHAAKRVLLRWGLLRFPTVSPSLHLTVAIVPRSALQHRHAEAPPARTQGAQGEAQNPPEERPRRNIDSSDRKPRHILQRGGLAGWRSGVSSFRVICTKAKAASSST